jgi:hypothetical protein
MRMCSGCGKRPAEVHGERCVQCWHATLASSLLTAFSFLEDVPVRIEGGYRMAVVFDGEIETAYWLCDDVHETEEEARSCLRNGCIHGPGPHWNDQMIKSCIERRRALRSEGREERDGG